MTDTFTPEKLNGTAAPEPVRVRFGPGKSQTMPIEWAEHILTALAEDKTKFGKFLTDAALAAK